MLVGGADPTRKYWTAFLQDTDFLLFVVDSSDPNKLPLAASALKHLVGDTRMDTVPVLVIANKQVNIMKTMLCSDLCNILMYLCMKLGLSQCLEARRNQESFRFVKHFPSQAQSRHN